jgi:hypothetical protein
MTDSKNDCTYYQWLDSYFGFTLSETSFAPSGPWCDLRPAVSLMYLTRLFGGGPEPLRGYSDKQLNAGLWELVGASGELHVLSAADLPFDDIERCVAGIQLLFRDVLAPRCVPALGHLDEPGGSPLNSVCYMWWDIFPFVVGTDDQLGRALLRTVAAQLSIRHDAVIESALHGLAHARRSSDVDAVIDAFLARTPDLRPALRQYAQNARAGCVQ